MTRPVHVVASFNMDGKVIPLYFCLSLEKDAPAYKVTILNIRENKFGNYMATYYCTTVDKGKEIEFSLIFDASNHAWSLVLSNSRAFGLCRRQ